MGRWVALAFLALVALPTASADALLDVKASRATVRDDVLAHGAMAGLLIEDHGAGKTVPALRLRGPLLTLQNDTSDPNVYVPGGAVVRGVDGVTKTSTSHDFSAGELVVTASRSGYRANLYALDSMHPPRIEVRGSCSSLSPSDSDNITRLPRASSARPAIHIDAHSALMAQPCGSATLNVTGDLMLSMWETDARLSWSEGSMAIATGATQSQSAPVNARPFVEKWVETYVLAKNATLSVPLEDATALYVEQLAVDGRYTLEIQAASGRVRVGGQEVDVTGKTVMMHGTMSTNAAGSSVGGPLSVTSSGQVDAARIDSQTLVLPTPDGNVGFGISTGSTALGALFCLLVALAVADQYMPRRWFRQARRYGSLPPNYVATGGRERRAGGYWLKAQEWLERGWLRRASWASRRAIRLRPENTAHGVLRVTVLDERGRDKAALKVLQGLYGRVSPGRERATVALDIAASLVRLERRPEASSWLARADEEDPETVQESARNPYFRQLHGIRAPRVVPRHEPDPGFA